MERDLDKDVRDLVVCHTHKHFSFETLKELLDILGYEVKMFENNITYWKKDAKQTRHKDSERRDYDLHSTI